MDTREEVIFSLVNSRIWYNTKGDLDTLLERGYHLLSSQWDFVFYWPQLPVELGFLFRGTCL